MFATVPNPVVYENTIFHVKVHCAANAPKVCEGDVIIRVKGKGDTGGHYRVVPGKTKTVDADSTIQIGKETDTVYVSIDPNGETGNGDLPSKFVARRLVVRQNSGGGGGQGDYPFTHVVRDGRGDGAGPLDLRKAEAHVRGHRLILTWTCWGTVTPAKMDHDSASFDARVYTRKPDGVHHSRKHATVFYADHGPVLFAGAEFGPNDWGGRFYRPNRHAVRMSMPLSRFGRRIKQLWIEPATVGYAGGSDNTRATIHFRVRK